MSSQFDCYHVWLGIPPSEQPPNHYRLLGISIFETDPDVIDHAADRQMAHVRTFQSGKHGAVSQQVLNELSMARVCLLSPEKKAAYDEDLKRKVAAGGKAVPLAKAVPVAAPVAAATPLTKVPPPPQAARRPVAAPAKAAPPVATAVPVVNEVDLGLDLDAAAAVDMGEPISTLRSRRRRFGRNANWQSAAVMGTVAGVVVVVLFALYSILSKQAAGRSWSELWNSWTSPAPLESVTPQAAPKGPQAPRPAPATPGS